MSADRAPLILTLAFDDAAFAVLDGLRRQYFPAERNVISAHLTLFHHLPGDRFDDVAESIERVAGTTAAFTVTFASLRKLGRGTALNVVAPQIHAVRAPIAAAFVDTLTAQDRQTLRPHVTIQNKVDPAEASALYEGLTQTFVPWSATAIGLSLWRYRGGPWDPAGRFAFKPSA